MAQGLNFNQSHWFEVKGKLGGDFKQRIIFTPTWGADPIWQIFLKGVETTNQKKSALQNLLPGKLTNVPGKSMDGRCISYWTSPFSGDMLLIFRGVASSILCITIKPISTPKQLMLFVSKNPRRNIEENWNRILWGLWFLSSGVKLFHSGCSSLLKDIIWNAVVEIR